MTKQGFKRAASASLLIAYPLLVYFGLQAFDPRLLVLLLVLMAGLRWLAWDGEQRGMLVYWLAAIALVVVATMVSGSEKGLLFYPLIVNISFFSFFFISLFNPPTVIERFARKQQHDGELSADALRYTRRVTQVWCLFFIVNASISVWTVYHSREMWLLYNGLLSYLLTALLMGVEFLVRRKKINDKDLNSPPTVESTDN